MKIAYLINYPIDKPDGVIDKVKAQISEWRNLGNEVEIFALFSDVKYPVLEAKQYSISNSIARKLTLCRSLISNIKAFSPDLVYFRYTYWNRSLSYIQKRYINIVEINTDDIYELWLNFITKKSLRNFIKVLLNLVLRIPVLKNANAIITVTYELANNQHFTKFNIPIMTCPNSYNMRKNINRKNIANLSETNSLFFIGSPNQAWHGTDIIEILAKKIPLFNFHIVGVKGISHDNIYYHGYLQEKDYLPIMQQCCICIGTLALFRINLREACPLKVREYLARGFPVIIGYKDTIFVNKQTPNWILELDVRSNKIDINKIIEFVQKNRNRIVQKEEVAPYISSSIIEKQRVKFFEEIVYENINS